MTSNTPITIDELEALLNSEEEADIFINPDGTITRTTGTAPIPLKDLPRQGGEY